MEQISLPFRIALGALLVVAALWFTVLRPKPEAAPPPTAPGVAGLARATQGAKNAVAASKSSAAESEAAANRPGQTRSATPTKATAGVTKSAAAATSPKAATDKPVVKRQRVVARKTAPGAATKPSPTLVKADGGKDPSAPLLADLAKGRTLVLLFWSKKGSDDRAVRTALKGVGRHHGKVVVKSIPAKEVGNYEAITRGAQVLQSPTILVIGKDKKAHPIIGFTYAGEIDQLVSDVLAGRTP